MEIKYQDIIAVKQIEGAADAQLYLDCGWILLETAPSKDSSNPSIIFALGWSSTRGEVQQPAAENNKPIHVTSPW